MTSTRLKELFGEVIELPLAERASFLDAACRGDAELRHSIEQLLGAHELAGDFLAHPVHLIDAAARDAAEPEDHVAGQRIGAHELQHPLGRGGFGAVWRARQLHPVERDVAMKILHRPFDGGQPTERFVAELQALARMRHPGVAKVFDAGTTEDGRPWLTMELVEGEPITRHCDARGLPVAARLRLFEDVCAAVQHAHGKGIVHRDLKPSNVLVTERDGKACPVVIDFGVARAVDDHASRGDAPMEGTPDYMSPEQAAADDHAVDTRSDVYSLGVILYELVSGRRPQARRDGESTGEQMRRIRTDVPPPPSASSPSRLPREVDWIVARAMAKDPADRYPTVAALADDVRRVLACEPVLAGSSSSLYRLERFVRRHRLAVAAVAAVFVSLGAGTWLAVRGWLDASASERRAVAAAERARADQHAAEREASRASRAMALLDELWSGVDPARLGRPDYPVRELLADFERVLPTRLLGEPTVELPVRRTLARLHYFVGLLASAEVHATRTVDLSVSLQLPAEQVGGRLLRARVRFDRGDTDGAAADAGEVQRLCEVHALGESPLASALEILANCRARTGRGDEAMQMAEQALDVRVEAGEPLEIARSQMQLANLHGSVGRVPEAMELTRQALANLDALGPDHPDAIVAVQHLAYLEQRRGAFAEAEAGFRDSLARRLRVYGDGHPHVAWAEVDLAWVLHEQRRDAEAAPLLRSALPVLRQRLGEDHLYVTEAMQRAGTVALALGDRDEAERLLTAAAERFRNLPGHPVEGLVGCLGNLASLQWERGDRPTALATQEQSLQHAEAALPAAHYLRTVSMTNLAHMVAERGDVGRAITLLQTASARAAAAGRDGEVALQRQRLASLLRRVGRNAEADAVEAQGR